MGSDMAGWVSDPGLKADVFRPSRVWPESFSRAVLPDRKHLYRISWLHSMPTPMLAVGWLGLGCVEGGDGPVRTFSRAKRTVNLAWLKAPEVGHGQRCIYSGPISLPFDWAPERGALS